MLRMVEKSSFRRVSFFSLLWFFFGALFLEVWNTVGLYPSIGQPWPGWVLVLYVLPAISCHCIVLSIRYDEDV